MKTISIQENVLFHRKIIDKTGGVGGFLFDKSREVLYKLAHSDNPMERRSAIVSTYFFIRQNDLNDTFKIAEILVNDEDDLVQKAVGGWIREAGKRDINF